MYDTTLARKLNSNKNLTNSDLRRSKTLHAYYVIINFIANIIIISIMIVVIHHFVAIREVFESE